MNLDASASPEQVAFAALQAIRDDLAAKTPEERKKAVDIELDLAAANVIAERNKTRLADDAYVYSVVYHWTPTVSYYLGSFPTTWEGARQSLIARNTTEREVELALEVADPGGDPNARAVMLMWLARDKGFWRVLHFGFDHQRAIQAPAKAEGANIQGPQKE